MSDSNDSAEVAPIRLLEAFERVRPAMELLKDSELLPVNLPLLASVSTVRGALPGLLRMRPAIENAFRDFDISNLDRLELYAFGLTHAQAVFGSVTKRTRTLSQLSNEAAVVRGRFLRDLQALVQRGQIDGSRLSDLKGANGHHNIANDLLILVTILRECWTDVSNKTGVTLDELNRAELLSNNLVGAIGMRNQRPALAIEATDDRQRAYTLFIRAYSQVRRAVTYLRWENGDLESIAPSLYTKTHRSSKRSKKQPAAAQIPNESTTCDTTGAIASTPIDPATPTDPTKPPTHR